MSTKIRDLEPWEAELLHPILLRRARAQARRAELANLAEATDQELHTIELALSGITAAFHGPGADERIALDLDAMALFDATEADPVADAAARARDLVSGPLAEGEGTITPPTNDPQEES